MDYTLLGSWRSNAILSRKQRMELERLVSTTVVRWHGDHGMVVAAPPAVMIARLLTTDDEPHARLDGDENGRPDEPSD